MQVDTYYILHSDRIGQNRSELEIAPYEQDVSPCCKESDITYSYVSHRRGYVLFYTLFLTSLSLSLSLSLS